MLESIEFENYKALRKARLDLGPLTLIIGPNGSGKSSALRAIAMAAVDSLPRYEDVASSHGGLHETTTVVQRWRFDSVKANLRFSWEVSGDGTVTGSSVEFPGHPRDATPGGQTEYRELEKSVRTAAQAVRVYQFDAAAVAEPAQLSPPAEVQSNGRDLVAALHLLRDQEPDRFEALNRELAFWLPEFDRLLFDWAEEGQRQLQLRTASGGHKIAAKELSQGTLIALAILTIAYLPKPPSVVCLEEPDRAIHPRLLRHVQDALHRLAHPDPRSEPRPPVQVVATTHNPFFLDLFKDYPEDVVISEKEGLDVHFHRLVDMDRWEEILQGCRLGDAWYTGVLGGVPART
jgi:predicted ATPase